MLAMMGISSLVILGTRFGLLEMFVAMGGMGAVGSIFLLFFGDYDDYAR